MTSNQTKSLALHSVLLLSSDRVQSLQLLFELHTGSVPSSNALFFTISDVQKNCLTLITMYVVEYVCKPYLFFIVDLEMREMHHFSKFFIVFDS